MKTLGILISGRGSNMEAILDAIDDGRIPARVGLVISNVVAARGLERARARGVEAIALDHHGHTREEHDRRMRDELDRRDVEIVCLAGYMRLLSSFFIESYPNRILNIHPSLLPSFPGLHTHRQALAAGVKLHGCTVHVVTPSLDNGPIVIQAAVPVMAEDTEESLAERVLQAEHRIYPQAVQWFMEDRVEFLPGDVVRIRGSGVSTDCVVSPRDRNP